MLRETLRKYWGFDSFLPLQREAMGSVMEGRDSLVVLPTGGGKSLCYQAPAMELDGTAVVVSPLISLMKDQVDALRECGVPAARFDSSLSFQHQREVIDQFQTGELKLLYVSPERLMSERFAHELRGGQVSFIAVDEVHCVSMWGHDFRPEYRKLGALKEHFPDTALHAYTATATRQVREDIVETLGLDSPEVLVGSFDRPNLVYRARRRDNELWQVRQVIDRHPGQSGIIYRIRRKDVDEMAAALRDAGYSALPYHAGMGPAERKSNQNAFSRGETDIIVATVAFGMGIDKPDVRYVVHAGMPKTLEHYQQQSGRAGRDGLEAECCIFYSGGDYHTWKFLLSDGDPEVQRIHLRKLSDMYSFCTDVACRHRALVEYFGQPFEEESCGACDFCLGEVDCLEDSLETAQKILSCVVRLNQRFGATYTANVLVGSSAERIVENRHDELSTWGLLSEYPVRQVRTWIEQLVAQGCLSRTERFKVLKLTGRGADALRGEWRPRLSRPREKDVRTAAIEEESWEDVDPELFEHLRALRKELADRRGVPAFMVFGDATLRGICRRRPRTPAEFRQIKGIGEVKCRRYAETIIKAIRGFDADGV
ncbi:MAG: DNA helicase RecQ [Candidatus Brocadiia bacterium]